MSNAVSFLLLEENDVSNIYFVDSQSLGQKHCFLITKICKRLLDNVGYVLYILSLSTTTIIQYHIPSQAKWWLMSLNDKID